MRKRNTESRRVTVFVAQTDGQNLAPRGCGRRSFIGICYIVNIPKVTCRVAQKVSQLPNFHYIILKTFNEARFFHQI